MDVEIEWFSKPNPTNYKCDVCRRILRDFQNHVFITLSETEFTSMTCLICKQCLLLKN